MGRGNVWTVGESKVASSGGRPPKLDAAAQQHLRSLALQHPNATVDDLRERVRQQLGVPLCSLSIYRYLKRVGIKRAHPGEPPTYTAQPPSGYGHTEGHRDQGDATHYPGALTDAEWALVADLFEQTGPGKPPRYQRRLMIDACCYAVRTGCPWRMLPKDLPRWQDVYAHFRRWTDRNLFETMHDRLRAMWRQRLGRKAEPTAAVIDSQSAKTSAQGGPKGYARARRSRVASGTWSWMYWGCRWRYWCIRPTFRTETVRSRWSTGPWANTQRSRRCT